MPKTGGKRSVAAEQDRKRRFVKLYLKLLNGKQAAIEAGYPPGSAAQTASHMLARDEFVITELQKQRQVLYSSYDISTERIVAELAKLGFSKLAKFTKLVGDDRIIDLSEDKVENDPDDAAAAIAELTTEIHDNGDDKPVVKKTKIKMHNKQAALETLLKHVTKQFGNDEGGDSVRIEGGLPDE